MVVTTSAELVRPARIELLVHSVQSLASVENRSVCRAAEHGCAIATRALPKFLSASLPGRQTAARGRSPVATRYSSSPLIRPEHREPSDGSSYTLVEQRLCSQVVSQIILE